MSTPLMINPLDNLYIVDDPMSIDQQRDYEEFKSLNDNDTYHEIEESETALLEQFEELVAEPSAQVNPIQATPVEEKEKANDVTITPTLLSGLDETAGSYSVRLRPGIADFNPLNGISSLTTVFANIMGLTNTSGMPLDPEGLLGQGIFGNFIGDSAREVQTEGSAQANYMGFLPPHAIQKQLIKHGV